MRSRVCKVSTRRRTSVSNEPVGASPAARVKMARRSVASSQSMLLDLGEEVLGEEGTSEAQRNLRKVDAAPHSESSNAEISLVASASNILANADENSLASRGFLADLPPSLESERGAVFSFAHALRSRSRPSEAIKCAFPGPKY